MPAASVICLSSWLALVFRRSVCPANWATERLDASAFQSIWPVPPSAVRIELAVLDWVAEVPEVAMTERTAAAGSD